MIFNGINVHTKQQLKIIPWLVNKFDGGIVLIPCNLVLLFDENYKKYLVKYNDLLTIFSDLLYPVSNYGINVKLIPDECIDEVLFRFEELIKLSLPLNDFKQFNEFSKEYEDF